MSEQTHPEDGRDVQIPLRKLVELTLQFPDMGPPLAELAFAIGQKETGDQLLRMGTDRENPALEYYFVASQASRRTRRYAEALKSTLDALAAYEKGSYGPDEGERLLHLVRAGLSVLMFDLKDLTAEPQFGQTLAETLPRLEDRLGEQPMYRSLLAQALWFTDKDASEREWERARDAGDPESIWNARGTWYKEAERDLEKAEKAYRRGLEKAGASALLQHNLAQVLVERAERAPSPGVARPLLNQAQDLLRRSLQGDNPRLRRHIHATRDKLEAIRRTLPPPEPPAPRQDYPQHQGGYPQQQGGYPQQQGGYPQQQGGYPQQQGGYPPAPPRDQQPRGEYRGDRGDRGDRGPRRDNRPPPQHHKQQQRPPQPQSAPQQAAPPAAPPPQAPPPPPRKQEDPGQNFLRTGKATLGDLLKAKLKDKG